MERKKSWENKFPPPMNRACYSNLDTMGELSDSPFNGKPATKYRNMQVIVQTRDYLKDMEKYLI